MIDRVHLRHFKCFERLDLPLGKLTLLTGLNATGKSSILQSLLLLHQSLVANITAEHLRLNGDSASLGTFGDVLDRLSGRESFGIGVTTNNTLLEWEFVASDRSAVVADLNAVLVNGKPIESSDDRSLARILRDPKTVEGEPARKAIAVLLGLLHVSTERIGPRETYHADDSEESGKRLGARGEYTAWYLHRNEESNVQPNLRKENAPPTLIRQAESWMAAFFPGSAFQIDRIKGTRLVSLRFRTNTRDAFDLPANVGYGLSHLFPVVVGGLGVQQGQLFIVENPESHLHPAAQSEVGRFLAAVAAGGAQVLVESHSDHVLNGVRLAVKDGCLQKADLALHFFQSREAGKPQIVSPQVDAKGNIDSWPGGFFDQYEKDLDSLTT
jgi:predicted ATPase